MDAISAFFVQNIVYVYFFYGLAFFAMGLVVWLESGRATEFRFARALPALALFGFVHGAHEWFEMFQIFIAHQASYTPGVIEETIGTIVLALSFLLLLTFGIRLLSDDEQRPCACYLQVTAMAVIWLAGVGAIYWFQRPSLLEMMTAADVLARYSLGIPGSLLASWALLRERRDFHVRGMSRYGRDLLWAALAFFVYGVIGQFFTRPSLTFPSQTINTALFLRTFGIPVQLLRGVAAVTIAVTLGRALRAFEMESRLRLARANKARIEAQAAALHAQQRRADEVEALNVQLQATAGELSAMVALAHILTSTLDLRRLLESALYQVVHSFECACCAVVFLLQPDGSLRPMAGYRRPHTDSPANCPPLDQTALLAVQTRGPTGMPGDTNTEVQPLDESGFASGLSYRTLGLPLKARDQILGAITLASQHAEERLGANELRLLTAFAQQIAAAIQNVRLYQVVQEREMQLGDLVGKLVNAQEDERQRIARELHDETGQKLSALAMGLAAAENALQAGKIEYATKLLSNLRGLNDQTIVELRNIMTNLRPAQLDDLGLVPALRWYIQQFNEQHPEMTATLTATIGTPRLPSSYEIVLFRVTQEALTNVARHAHATHVEVALSQQDGYIKLQVADNGIGFQVDAPAKHAPGSGLGLPGMRERVALVGGQFTVESQPGQGTRITVTLPARAKTE